MGIGLTPAGHLVGRYEGTVTVNSLPGQGTVARVAQPAGVSRPRPLPSKAEERMRATTEKSPFDNRVTSQNGEAPR